MANYICSVRTNYFRVEDPEEFRKIMARVYGCEDTVELFDRTTSDGTQLFGFGCYGGIVGLTETKEDAEEDPDAAFDAFIEALQTCVAADDAIIIFETGHEKLRYLIGSATIITKNRVEYFDISDAAVGKAKEMLGDPNWETITCY